MNWDHWKAKTKALVYCFTKYIQLNIQWPLSGPCADQQKHFAYRHKNLIIIYNNSTFILQRVSELASVYVYNCIGVHILPVSVLMVDVAAAAVEHVCVI